MPPNPCKPKHPLLLKGNLKPKLTLFQFIGINFLAWNRSKRRFKAAKSFKNMVTLQFAQPTPHWMLAPRGRKIQTHPEILKTLSKIWWDPTKVISVSWTCQLGFHQTLEKLIALKSLSILVHQAKLRPRVRFFFLRGRTCSQTLLKLTLKRTMHLFLALFWKRNQLISLIKIIIPSLTVTTKTQASPFCRETKWFVNPYSPSVLSISLISAKLRLRRNRQAATTLTSLKRKNK